MAIQWTGQAPIKWTLTCYRRGETLRPFEAGGGKWLGAWLWIHDPGSSVRADEAEPGWVRAAWGFRHGNELQLRTPDGVALARITNVEDFEDVPTQARACPVERWKIHGLPGEPFIGPLYEAPVPGGLLGRQHYVAMALEDNAPFAPAERAALLAAAQEELPSHSELNCLAAAATVTCRRLRYRKDRPFRTTRSVSKEAVDQWDNPFHAPFSLAECVGDCEECAFLALSTIVKLGVPTGYVACLAVVVLGSGRNATLHALALLVDHEWLERHWDDPNDRSPARLPHLPLEGVNRLHAEPEMGDPPLRERYSVLVALIRATGVRVLSTKADVAGVPWESTEASFVPERAEGGDPSLLPKSFGFPSVESLLRTAAGTEGLWYSDEYYPLGRVIENRPIKDWCETALLSVGVPRAHMFARGRNIREQTTYPNPQRDGEYVYRILLRVRDEGKDGIPQARKSEMGFQGRVALTYVTRLLGEIREGGASRIATRTDHGSVVFEIASSCWFAMRVEYDRPRFRADVGQVRNVIAEGIVRDVAYVVVTGVVGPFWITSDQLGDLIKYYERNRNTMLHTDVGYVFATPVDVGLLAVDAARWYTEAVEEDSMHNRATGVPRNGSYVNIVDPVGYGVFPTVDRNADAECTQIAKRITERLNHILPGCVGTDTNMTIEFHSKVPKDNHVPYGKEGTRIVARSSRVVLTKELEGKVAGSRTQPVIRYPDWASFDTWRFAERVVLPMISVSRARLPVAQPKPEYTPQENDAGPPRTIAFDHGATRFGARFVDFLSALRRQAEARGLQWVDDQSTASIVVTMHAPVDQRLPMHRANDTDVWRPPRVGEACRILCLVVVRDHTDSVPVERIPFLAERWAGEDWGLDRFWVRCVDAAPCDVIDIRALTEHIVARVYVPDAPRDEVREVVEEKDEAEPIAAGAVAEPVEDANGAAMDPIEENGEEAVGAGPDVPDAAEEKAAIAADEEAHYTPVVIVGDEAFRETGGSILRVMNGVTPENAVKYRMALPGERANNVMLVANMSDGVDGTLQMVRKYQRQLGDDFFVLELTDRKIEMWADALNASRAMRQMYLPWGADQTVAVYVLSIPDGELYNGQLVYLHAWMGRNFQRGPVEGEVKQPEPEPEPVAERIEEAPAARAIDEVVPRHAWGALVQGPPFRAHLLGDVRIGQEFVVALGGARPGAFYVAGEGEDYSIVILVAARGAPAFQGAIPPGPLFVLSPTDEPTRQAGWAVHVPDFGGLGRKAVRFNLQYEKSAPHFTEDAIAVTARAIAMEVGHAFDDELDVTHRRPPPVQFSDAAAGGGSSAAAAAVAQPPPDAAPAARRAHAGVKRREVILVRANADARTPGSQNLAMAEFMVLAMGSLMSTLGDRFDFELDDEVRTGVVKSDALGVLLISLVDPQNVTHVKDDVMVDVNHMRLRGYRGRMFILHLLTSGAYMDRKMDGVMKQERGAVIIVDRPVKPDARTRYAYTFRDEENVAAAVEEFVGAVASWENVKYGDARAGPAERKQPEQHRRIEIKSEVEDGAFELAPVGEYGIAPARKRAPAFKATAAAANAQQRRNGKAPAQGEEEEFAAPAAARGPRRAPQHTKEDAALLAAINKQLDAKNAQRAAALQRDRQRESAAAARSGPRQRTTVVPKAEAAAAAEEQPARQRAPVRQRAPAFSKAGARNEYQGGGDERGRPARAGRAGSYDGGGGGDAAEENEAGGIGAPGGLEDGEAGGVPIAPPPAVRIGDGDEPPEAAPAAAAAAADNEEEEEEVEVQERAPQARAPRARQRQPVVRVERNEDQQEERAVRVAAPRIRAPAFRAAAARAASPASSSASSSAASSPRAPITPDRQFEAFEEPAFQPRPRVRGEAVIDAILNGAISSYASYGIVDRPTMRNDYE